MQVAYFCRATEYYASGRHASLSQLFPVGATLLHHAVELYLKGALLPHLSLDALRELRHNLKALWREFIAQTQDSTLAAHRDAIAALHKFERIRYPDVEVLKGASATFAVLRTEAVPRTAVRGAQAQVPKYDLILEDVDHIVDTILKTANVNVAAYAQMLSPEAHSYINQRNAYAWRIDA